MAADEEGRESQNRREAALKRWRDAKFGIFVHWGLYSIPGGIWKGQIGGGGEWNAGNYAEHLQMRLKIPNEEYAELCDQFNPVQFDADEWVALARQAGMKHMVITAKHQDGFAMYDSEVSDFNIVDATPFGRDPMKELAAAAHRQDLGFGFYYSQARDHHHPLANWNKHGNTWDFPQQSRQDFITYLNEKAKPQIRELLTGYGDLTLMWFDVPYNIPPEQSREIADLIDAAQPGCIVNSRLGGDVWDYRTLGDNEIADEALDEPWETCMTMNNSWGFHQLDEHWKSTEQLIRALVDIVSKGGCLLLNVGPTAEGLIPEASATRLKQMGKWLATNGEAIYGTSPTPIGQPDWGRCTAKGNHLYLHVFDWPTDGTLKLSGVAGPASRAYTLASGEELAFARDGAHIAITLPQEPANDACTVIVLES